MTQVNQTKETNLGPAPLKSKEVCMSGKDKKTTPPVVPNNPAAAQQPNRVEVIAGNTDLLTVKLLANINETLVLIAKTLQERLPKNG